MQEKEHLEKTIIDNLSTQYKDAYILLPFIVALISYYIFFRFHHYAYEANTTELFLLYFGPNIILFSLVLGFFIYRYKYHIPLLQKNYTIEDIKPYSNKIIFSYTLRYIPIVFLFLQVFFYATNIYLERSSFMVQTKIEQVGQQFKFLAPSHWVSIRLPDASIVRMQSLHAKQIGDEYNKKIHEGFWTKFTDL